MSAGATASRVPALKATTSRVPTLALDVSEACAALGVSWDTWREHVEPDVRVVRLGRRKLVAVTELQRFLDDHGERLLATAKEPR